MKGKKKLWIGCIAGGVVMITLLVIFLTLSKEFYLGRFTRNTIVSNTDVSAMTAGEAVSYMNQADGFDILIRKNGEEYKIDVSQAVTREFDETQVEESRQNISFWDYLSHERVEVSLQPERVQVDETALRRILKNNLPETTTYTSDAYFDRDLNLIPEVQGDEVNFEQFLRQVANDIVAGNVLEYELSDFYYPPEVTSEDDKIVEFEKEINAYRELTLTFPFGNKKEEINSDQICSNLVYKDGKLKLKMNWVEPFVRKMAKKYNTYGKTRRFKTTKDGVVTIKGGILGWWINEEATVKKIKKALKACKSKTMEPVYRNVAVKHGKDDVGSTYVEVSLKRQHMWFYKNGKKKLESKIVSGKPTPDRETVKGIHRIFGKQRDRWLGTIAVQGYRTHVDYWMPFNWHGQGLHDAPWRYGRFGGNIYQSSGSHGCVNLPVGVAAKLYDLVNVGTPVVVY